MNNDSRRVILGIGTAAGNKLQTSVDQLHGIKLLLLAAAKNKKIHSSGHWRWSQKEIPRRLNNAVLLLCSGFMALVQQREMENGILFMKRSGLTLCASTPPRGRKI